LAAVGFDRENGRRERWADGSRPGSICSKGGETTRHGEKLRKWDRPHGKCGLRGRREGR